METIIAAALIVALLMALAKRVVVGHNQVTRWDRSNTLGMELKGRTLGVVGYGRIGRRVVEICGLGLRMNVIVFDPFLPASVAITQPAVERVYSLDELLKQADRAMYKAKGAGRNAARFYDSVMEP